jgi:hypothetical protein
MIYLVLSAFTSSSTSLLASTKAYMISILFVFNQHINIISINQELICSIQLKSLIFFDFPYGIF